MIDTDPEIRPLPQPLTQALVNTVTPGRVMDAWVAYFVLGWFPCGCGNPTCDLWTEPYTGEIYAFPNYSTDTDDSLRVLQALHGKGITTLVRYDPYRRPDDMQYTAVVGECRGDGLTEAEAICRAALRYYLEL